MISVVYLEETTNIVSSSCFFTLRASGAVHAGHCMFALLQGIPNAAVMVIFVLVCFFVFAWVHLLGQKI